MRRTPAANTSTSQAACLPARANNLTNSELPPEDDCKPNAPVPAGAFSRELPIINKRGLHARASAKFVQMAEKYDAIIKVTRCGETVNGDSIMGLLMLAAGPGTTIQVTCEGAQAQEALDALENLLATKFGEEE
ncbi:MAG: HPr family phosphocarrier protein [Xanthobacteraceae bacterium]|nr:HPr family phosphocarrier protein [Xanthobacteraceae bacterium]MBX3533859.1 HPr family phosphocarrier protein [Xanthobacteraceae bacterium]MBX3549386.1 HPr family phosphocarrier protein [Xanthobacteraceae bacterium]MCW5678965.1 HPr family phosphocarrier protein [Xanthobacteraceae bacterium]